MYHFLIYFIVSLFSHVLSYKTRCHVKVSTSNLSSNCCSWKNYNELTRNSNFISTLINYIGGLYQGTINIPYRNEKTKLMIWKIMRWEECSAKFDHRCFLMWLSLDPWSIGHMRKRFKILNINIFINYNQHPF